LPWSHIAHRRPTWALRCWPIWPRTTSAMFRPDNSSNVQRRLPHHGSPGTTPGPLLQLVRHAIPETFAAPLHFVGGQREPGGPSADIAAGSARLADHKILGTRFFEGLSDTLRILAGRCGRRSEAYAPNPSARLQQEDLESATRSQPTTLVASRQCMIGLATSAAEWSPAWKLSMPTPKAN
jgi:hypothetical protein